MLGGMWGPHQICTRTNKTKVNSLFYQVILLAPCRVLNNPINAELDPICQLLTLLGAHHIIHVSRIRVKEHFLVNVLELLWS